MKKTKPDIFDRNNTEDLPQSIIENMKTSRFKHVKRLVIELFDIKDELTVNDVIIGLYRLHKIEVDRKWVNVTMYNLNKVGTIKLIKEHQGIYKRIKK